jgi:lycopene cyclase domain-containing protein
MEFLETKYLYFYVLIFALSYPLAQSFEHRITYYRKWKKLFAGIAAMMVVFIPWDIWFTDYGVWWFNHDYTSGLRIFLLPIEEWLFFILIPFACFFIYEVLNYFVKKDVLRQFARPFLTVLSLSLLVASVVFVDKLYPFFTFLATGILGLVTVYFNPKWLGRFLLMYFVSLIPFLLVNGILTGSLIQSPVVNYNPDEIIGFRIITIPFEDSIYNLMMLLMVMWVYKGFDTESNP